MRIFFSVGEPSGDLHGANLIRDLRKRCPDIECVGFGGPKMRNAGCDILYELTQLAVMFIVTALFHIHKFFQVLFLARRYFREHQVDAVVLIDFPGFNWWIARAAKKHGIPVFYYGVPQMWAWAPWRIRKMRRLVDLALCKLPFEKKWYQDRGCNAEYVGHPYFDELASRKLNEPLIDQFKSNAPRRLTLLPGSRKQEVVANTDSLLSVGQRVQRQCPDVQIAFACYKESQREYIESRMEKRGIRFETAVQQTPELIEAATVCVACSGSVSLELMYHRKPTVIVYRLGLIKWFLQSALLKIKFITLVNLLAANSIERRSWKNYNPDAIDAERVPMPEYLSVRDCSNAVAARVIKLFTDPETYAKSVKQLDELANRYADAGATSQAATIIANQLSIERADSLSHAA